MTTPSVDWSSEVYHLRPSSRTLSPRSDRTWTLTHTLLWIYLAGLHHLVELDTHMASQETRTEGRIQHGLAPADRRHDLDVSALDHRALESSAEFSTLLTSGCQLPCPFSNARNVGYFLGPEGRFLPVDRLDTPLAKGLGPMVNKIRTWTFRKISSGRSSSRSSESSVHT